MKTIIKSIIILAVAFTAVSCSTPQNTMSSTPTVSRGKFVGKWALGSIRYEGLVENAVQNVFDQAKPSAFRGSIWELTNSGNGRYTLNTGVSQTIFWSVNNGDANGQIFQFKKIYQGDRPKNIAEGYQLYVVSNNGDTMTLKSAVPVGNSTAWIIYEFTKQP